MARIVFVFLALATVVLVVVGISLAHSAPPCQGLSCPSGGGAASSSPGVPIGSILSYTFAGMTGVGTLLSGIAAFRK